MQTVPVVNSILWTAYSKKKDDDLTPLRMQKLLYFLHGWYTAITGVALLSEPFVHMTYGPVLLDLEAKLAHFAGVPIDDYVKEFNLDFGMDPLFVDEEKLPQFREILNAVWDKYTPLTTVQLSSIAHAPGSPWSMTAYGQPISTKLIAEDFKRLSLKK